MTIHELLQAAGLTANDEIPIWDADGTGEPTKKITAQQLAAAVVALANLVTSVNNQTGAVSITPANIGAVAKSGDTMTGQLETPSVELRPAVGATHGGYIDFHYSGSSADFTSRLAEGAQGVLDINGVSFDRANPFISIPNGGTGATTPAGARNNLGIHTFHGNVTINSNGQGFISFSDFGLSSRPNVCFMEIVNVANTTVRYNYGASTSQIVLEPFWINATSITSTTIEMQGVAFA